MMLQQSTPSERLMYAAHKERMNRLWPAKVCTPPKPKPPGPKIIFVKLPISNDQFKEAWEILDGRRGLDLRGMSQSEAVKRAVCAYYNVNGADLVSHRRTGPLIRPRQMAMLLLKHTTTLSIPQIGRLIGKRDHTTVLYAVKKLENLAKIDKVLASEIADLKKMIGCQ